MQVASRATRPLVAPRIERDLEDTLLRFAHTANVYLSDIQRALRETGRGDIAEELEETHKQWCAAAGRMWEAVSKGEGR